MMEKRIFSCNHLAKAFSQVLKWITEKIVQQFLRDIKCQYQKINVFDIMSMITKAWNKRLRKAQSQIVPRSVGF